MIDYRSLIQGLFKSAKREKEDKVYVDEPISRPASQADQKLPEGYRRLSDIANSPEAFRNSESWLFYHQAKAMEDFEDDFPYKGDFVRYTPTYQVFTNDQKRGYFTWRADVRKGITSEAPTPYIFLYIYELLNLIGVKNAEDGFALLRDFYENFKEICPAIEPYISTWLSDFAAYYGVDKTLAARVCAGDNDPSLLILQCTDGKTDLEVFNAICQLSSYKIASSRFYKDHPDDVVAVCRRVYDNYSEFYNKNRKRTLFEAMFGNITTFPYYRMFSSAVFYGTVEHRDTIYEINPLRRYIYKNGFWSKEYFSRADGKSSKLGEIIKSIDSIMRRKYSYKYPLKFECPTKQLSSLIEKVTEEYLCEKKNAEKKDISIDLSKLCSIRTASDITRQWLTVEEDYIEEPDTSIDASFEENFTVLEHFAENEENEAGLDETEYTFMKKLLYGGDHMGFIRSRKAMISVVVDSVNEKLYDMLNDTALEFDGEEPIIIKDYIEELKRIIK